MRLIAASACLLGVSCLAVAAEPAANKGGDVVAGKALFSAKCVTCHAKDGRGNPAMAKMFKTDQQKMDLTGEDLQKKGPEEILKTVAEGRNKMPAFKAKMKEDEIADVIAYVRSLGGAPAKPPTPGK